MIDFTVPFLGASILLLSIHFNKSIKLNALITANFVVSSLFCAGYYYFQLWDYIASYYVFYIIYVLKDFCLLRWTILNRSIPANIFALTLFASIVYHNLVIIEIHFQVMDYLFFDSRTEVMGTICILQILSMLVSFCNDDNRYHSNLFRRFLYARLSSLSLSRNTSDLEK